MIDPKKPAPAKSRPFSLLPPAPLLRIGLLVICAASLSHCAGKGYKAANYSRSKLATPPHNLSQRDYPFDADGNYRKDWVTRGSRTVSGNGVRSRAATTASTRSASTASSTTSRAASTPPSRSTQVAAASSAPPRPAPKPRPKPKPKPAARYHSVQAGHTLWSISQKYGVSVAALKKANGLSSDLIRPGQSLRIP